MAGGGEQEPGPYHVSTFLLRRGTALLGSMANPISARFCRTDLAWSQACRMWELHAKRRRSRNSQLAGRPGRGPLPPEPRPPHHSIRGAAFRRAFRFRRFRLTFFILAMGTTGPVTPEAPFEPSKPPVIEGFSPSVYSTPESFKEKFLRKTRENPMVPIGCLGTAAALTYGLYCFHRGQSQRSQFMMRTRIAAQGFTVAAILLGLAASAMKSRP
uniref:HIG1 domain-containing protein n=3 Tax=Equus TaxID=9789 RepID=F6V2I8_HORSE